MHTDTAGVETARVGEANLREIVSRTSTWRAGLRRRRWRCVGVVCGYETIDVQLN